MVKYFWRIGFGLTWLSWLLAKDISNTLMLVWALDFSKLILGKVPVEPTWPDLFIRKGVDMVMVLYKAWYMVIGREFFWYENVCNKSWKWLTKRLQHLFAIKTLLSCKIEFYKYVYGHKHHKCNSGGKCGTQLFYGGFRAQCTHAQFLMHMCPNVCVHCT